MFQLAHRGASCDDDAAPGTQTMTELQLANLLQALSDGLFEREIRAVLFGGFALPIYGVERVTLDLDFLLCDADLSAFGDIIQAVGYREVLRTRQYAKFRHATETSLDIDTVFVDPPAMERIWADSIEQKMGCCTMHCASLDVMLGTKLHAIRHNEQIRGRRDFDDVCQLLAVNAIDPNGPRFSTLCKKYGTRELRKRICSEISRIATN